MVRPFTLRLVLLAVAFSLLDVAGHVLGPVLTYPDPSPLLAHPPLMKGVALALLVAAFSAAAFTYLRFEPGLPGGHGAWRSLRFGLAWAGFWLVGGLEMPLLSGGNAANELLTAVIDASALLGVLVVTGALAGPLGPGRLARSAPVNLIQPVLVVASAALGRVAANLVSPAAFAGASPALDALATVAWSLAVSGVYLALRPALGEGGPWRRGARVTLAFGVSLLLNVAFLPVFTRVDPLPFLARIGIVLAFSAAGFIAAESCSGARRGSVRPRTALQPASAVRRR